METVFYQVAIISEYTGSYHIEGMDDKLFRASKVINGKDGKERAFERAKYLADTKCEFYERNGIDTCDVRRVSNDNGEGYQVELKGRNCFWDFYVVPAVCHE